MKQDDTDYAGFLDAPNPNGPILDVKDLAALLRTRSVEAARAFAREHLKEARLGIFGARWKFSRKRVLEILNLTDT